MKDIVNVAIGEIGYREQGSNKTKYGVQERMVLHGAIRLFHGVHMKPGYLLPLFRKRHP